MIAQIDQFMTDNIYRQSFDEEEFTKIFADFGIVPHRKHLTRSEVYDKLLDLRNRIGKEQDGVLQEELDALIGSDIATG